MTWRFKSQLFLGISLFLASILFVQMGLFVLHHVFGLLITFNIFQICISFFKGNSIVYHTVLFVINIYIGLTIILIGKNISQQMIGLKKLKSKISLLANKEEEEKLKNMYPFRIKVINTQEPVAFTFGFLRPKIVLSTGLINILNEQELEAVIHHETAHQKYHDPTSVFTLRLLSEVFWYIPLLKWVNQNFRMMIELAADEHAVVSTGSEIGLGSALIKLVKTRLKGSHSPSFVYFSDGTAVEYRIRQLLEPERLVSLKCPKGSILLSSHIVLLLLALLISV